MATEMKQRFQHASTVLIASIPDAGAAQLLKRLQLTAAEGDPANTYSEAWLQHLIHRHPSILPVAEMEPGLGRLIPVGMEVPTPAGYIDNLFVTAEGHLVVVECKLWRNPEARRKVLAQIIDYAQSVSSWQYDDLEKAIRKSVGLDKKLISSSLLNIVRNDVADTEEVDEALFIDAVQRNLRIGRMLLLVVGDGIREGTESLKDFLQQHAGFHFTLGLIETAVHELPDKQLLVQPRILARTLNIERAVITLVDGKASASPSPSAEAQATSPRAISLSEESYFERLQSAKPETAAALKTLVAAASDIGVFLDVATKSVSLKWESPLGRLFNLGGIDLEGRLTTYSVCRAPHAMGHVEVGQAYLEALAGIADAQVRQTKTVVEWYLVSIGTTLPSALPALRRASDWIERIRTYQQRISAIEAEVRGT